jgi:hypothetical protein
VPTLHCVPGCDETGAGVLFVWLAMRVKNTPRAELLAGQGWGLTVDTHPHKLPLVWLSAN